LSGYGPVSFSRRALLHGVISLDDDDDDDNKPDITIKDKIEKSCTLTDVAIPADKIVVQKEAEKKLKYKSLCIEIQRMWNLKCAIVPVITGAT